MAKVMEWDEFKTCPRGTIFSYGVEWYFSGFLILDATIELEESYGFWAIDPMWVDCKDSGEGFSRLEEMNNGATYPMTSSSSRTMNYDDDMNKFFVFEQSDFDILKQLTCYK